MKKFQFLIIALAVFASACNQSAKPKSATGVNEVQSNDSRSFRNLTVFLVCGENRISRNYLSLEEAMNNGSIVLHETGSVGELSADNKSDKYIFIMSGDIVKGGKQDRTIAEDIILQPACKNVPLKSFCVEASRWQQRGHESAAEFSSSKNMLSNKNLKIAAREKKEQGEVWKEVSAYQSRVSANLKTDVKSSQSATSLQLTLENKDIQKAVKEYRDAIEHIFEGKTNVLGFAFCINGKISTVDMFGSASLFSKLKSKLLESAINEAVFQYDEKLKFEKVTAADVHSFINSAREATETTRETGTNTVEKKYTTAKRILFDTFNTDAGKYPVHTTIYQIEDLDTTSSGKARISEPDVINRGMPRR
jgi:hypothetical protein